MSSIGALAQMEEHSVRNRDIGVRFSEAPFLEMM
jgi:hypothetical protein